MTIAATDVKLMASVVMSDSASGGGLMANVTLQDGVENNVFPDVSTTDRAFGRLALRKVYPSVLSANTDAFMGSHMILDTMPADTNVTAFALAGVNAAEVHSQVIARLSQIHWQALGATLSWTGESQLTGSANAPVSVGSVIFTKNSGGTAYDAEPVLITGATSAGTNIWNVTYDGARRTGVTGSIACLGVPSTATPRLSSTRPVSGALSAGATYCDVDTLLAQIVPKAWGVDAGTAAQIGIDPATVLPAGVAAAFRSGDGLVLHHAADVAAATYINGNTVNCGRTNLSAVRVIGSDGASIYSGWTVNLATGIVTISSVAGWAQPVIVRHSIEETIGCARTGYPEIRGGATAGANVSTRSGLTLVDGGTLYCGATNVGGIRVYSRDGQDITDLTFLNGISPVATVKWFTIDLVAGTVKFHQPMADVNDTTPGAFMASYGPVTLVASGSYSATTTATIAQSTLNRISFNRPLTRAFPSGTLISSMLLLGDMQAAVTTVFSQGTWANAWADARVGDPISAQYQQVAHPIEVTNAGAITERWALIFTSATAYRVVGETVGQITTGDINSDLAPINPATGEPYFTLRATGWGSGWSAGNVLRPNTIGANAPAWVARAVLPSAPSSTPDSVTLAIRGDVNA
jgi:hypothetical protein